MSWQPIETAPRDGTWFIVWMPHDRPHDLPRVAHFTIWPRLVRGEWKHDQGPYEYAQSGCGPSNPPKGALWHPLPEPPKP